MDQALLNALREEDHKGNRLDGGWTTEGYNNVAEDEVWADLIKVKPHATKWKKHPIKNYDILKELFETDRAAGKQTKTTKERRKQLEKENIDLNNDYDDAEIYGSNDYMFDEHQLSNPDFENVSPQNGPTNSSADTHTSKGKKRKRTMVELVEDQYEHMNEDIMTIAEALKEGNAVSKEIHQVAERQVEIAERQVAVIEKQVKLLKNNLLSCNKLDLVIILNLMSENF
ncbi:hypothetical protein MTR_7g451740 [Medicago truncatula]|uniref:Myb/SANT-like domain-containing protein n=1 Tax=Medicago truncatula TaxID=3880 RepID=A0A072U9D7_MEDTR|nr:hypothetical protein MTR_7g047540 [Medicago truncatula]KEH22505.1 hypothetical protein MTR_7g451740 [Medicago truncatula]